MDQKLQDSIENFEKALKSLQQAAREPIRTERDTAGIIKMFELLFETCWKCLKRLLSVLGRETLNPRETLKTAFEIKIIDNNEGWLRILKDRNVSVHVYDQSQAQQLVKRIVETHLSLFAKCLENTKNQCHKTLS